VAARRRSLPRPPAVARILERVTKTARAHDMFRPGETVLVSVSGGPDSVCLLESLVRLRRLFRIRLEVFHFDHALRDDSADDAAYVRRLAERHGLPFHLRVASSQPRRGMSVEAWATAERGDASDAVRSEIGATVVAEAHTLDDQAETVLLNVIRGTGLEGVAGIPPRGGDRSQRRRRPAVIVQPLLEVERAEVEAFCRALRLRPRRDPMNDDTRFLRAAIRHDVIPTIERAVGRDVKRPIARTAENLRADRDVIDHLTVLALGGVVEEERARGVRFDVARLLGLQPVIARRVIRMGVYNVLSSDDAAPWSKDAIEAVLDLANGRPGRRRDLPNGSTAVRDRRYVRVSFAPSSPEG
jgi:tRNA(Ile)-lysidine synthetase-like protein